MGKVWRKLQLWIYIAVFLLFAVKSESVMAGAKDGVTLCLYTVIPALFPFLLIGSMVSSAAYGTEIAILRPLCGLCGIPMCAEGIFLVGILGGYPAGAHAVAQSYHNGVISHSEAKHLLRFCNNAGPAFIFGIIGSIVQNIPLTLFIWLIHILSAIFTGYIFADKQINAKRLQKVPATTFVKGLENTVLTMGKICGWVLLFRIVLVLLEECLFNRLDILLTTILSGMLELSNGCLQLTGADQMTVYFIATPMLTFGGLCVWLQTASVIGTLPYGAFAKGKVLQCIISLLLCCLLSPLFFSVPVFLPILSGAALLLLCICVKKVVAL